MASNNPSQPYLGQPKRTSFSAYAGYNASMIREKAKVGNRGSTPDSEALASSDDEQEHHHRLQSIAYLQSSRPVRRASWLSDIHQAPQQKSGSGFSPSTSHSTTPLNEATPWAAAAGSSTGSVTGRGHASSTSIPWGSAIWSTEAQKGPPSRLTEVLPSPTTLVPPSSSGSFMEDPLLSPTYCREHVTESAIPFAIPLHPTLKSYRSQSYSVGQLDVESASATPSTQSGYMANNRSRSGVPYAGLQHRPSRPSMLGDLSHDASLLGQLREVEDDDESSTGSETDIRTQARTIEQLARENAMLRQQAAEQLESTRSRNRASFTDTNNNAPRHAFSSSQQVRGYVLKDGQYGQQEVSDGQSYNSEGLRGRRSSEYALASSTHHAMTGIPEHRNLESFKKGHWQSSLGFGGVVEAPQSRRHSFAEVPTRQTSISSSGEINEGPKADRGTKPVAGTPIPLGYTENVARTAQGDSSEYTRFRCRQNGEEIELGLEHLRDRKFAVSYFSGFETSIRGEDTYEPSISPAAAYPPYHSNHLYGRPQNLGGSQPRAKQSFSLVTFKACRGEIFYASEGTGLQFTPGDLVIVEADRGTDLGTVAEVNCSWLRARELKDRSTEEHYKWLMMFSRHGQNGTAAAPTLDGQRSTSNGPHSSPAASNGASTSALGLQDSLSGELKPKVIKRLAQAHEIQTLREKEGNEAKAKRVCQQKVTDHRLNMEILDAEFQLDWKKLTFYYFADAYINFNPLVTDLFKIYKTRIWMSAINPASFVTPASALPVPSGLGPGAFLPESTAGSERRQYRTSPTSTSVSASRTGYGDARAWNPAQDSHSLGLMALSNGFPPSFHAPDFHVRQLDQYPMQYSHSAQQAYGIQPSYSPAVYSLPNMPHSLYATASQDRDDAARTPDALGTEWHHTFPGLSLGS
ncbi:MAG: hypothetical protein Q9168_000867 [Polycauliona sp. 1 TL-2023]